MSRLGCLHTPALTCPEKLLTVCVYTEPDENGNRRHIPFAAEINETSSMMKISVRAAHMLGGHHGSGSSFQLYWFVDETTNCWDDFVTVSHDLGEFDIVLSQDQIERVELSTMESVGILSRRRTKKQRQHTQQQTDEHRSRAQAETARDRDEYIRNRPAELDNESGRWYRAWSANGM